MPICSVYFLNMPMFSGIIGTCSTWNRPLMNLLFKSIVDLIYPPLCIHCDESLDRDDSLFCKSCLELLSLIVPEERCPYCFSVDFNAETEKCCQWCLEHPPLFERMGAAFDYEGVAASLIKQMKYGGQPFLAKGAAAYLVAQFVRLDWPMPDCIVPMPMAPLRRLERGYNQSLLLAESVGAFLNRPVLDVLKKRSGEFSQAGLNYQQRLQLSKESFSVKDGFKLHDQCVLLIDDVMTTGSSLNCCARALEALYPEKLYALTVCRAV